MRLTFQKGNMRGAHQLSDPFLVLYDINEDPATGQVKRQKLGITELFDDALDHVIDVDYHFERQQNMMIEVYDDLKSVNPKRVTDLSKITDLRPYQFIGTMEFKLGKLVTA